MIPAARVVLLEEFQNRLGYTFETLTLLDQALTHRSYVHETAGSAGDYERLEFLGDAVLGLIVSAHVYTTYPAAQEGQLSQLRAGLVNRATLASVARQLDMGRFLRLGCGEDQQGGRDRASVLAAAFEAVVAAIYLDGGSRPAHEAVLRHLCPVLAQCTVTTPGVDYKGALQSQSLSVFGCLPTYRVVHEEGPAHRKTFHVQLTLNREYACVGTGSSKKAAEQQAARRLLALLQPLPATCDAPGAGALRNAAPALNTAPHPEPRPQGEGIGSTARDTGWEEDHG